MENRYNYELYQLHNEPEIIHKIKDTRVRWLGHLFRTDELYLCRKVTFINPDGTREVGLPV
jgi:hypothetical protein